MNDGAFHHKGDRTDADYSGWYQGSYHGGDLQRYEFREEEVALAEMWGEFFVKPSTAARG